MSTIQVRVGGKDREVEVVGRMSALLVGVDDTDHVVLVDESREVAWTLTDSYGFQRLIEDARDLRHIRLDAAEENGL